MFLKLWIIAEARNTPYRAVVLRVDDARRPATVNNLKRLIVGTPHRLRSANFIVAARIRMRVSADRAAEFNVGLPTEGG
jgi:hypothetical protein